jgi:Patatin-like phospholipase
VAEDPNLTLNAKRPPNSGAAFKFHAVFRTETRLINERRRKQKDPRGTFRLEKEGNGTDGEPVLRPPEAANVVGLGLSGGGIRSASFCLGVLQALHETRVLERVDYLSTVSGGGYIGCSLTAALQAGSQQGAAAFPFASALKEDEPVALQHIRDYSNYLFPRGSKNFLRNASIYARGLAVNAVLVAQFLLVASALTLLYYSLSTEILAHPIVKFLNPFGWKHFFLSADLAVLLFVAGVVWGVVQSVHSSSAETEISGGWAKPVDGLILILIAVLFCELQPFVLDALIDTSGGNFVTASVRWIGTISAVLAPVGAAMAFFANKLGEYVKSTVEASGWMAWIKAYALKAAIFVGGLILPFGLWVIYLWITYWGLHASSPKCPCTTPASPANAASSIFAGPVSTALVYLAIASICCIVSLLMQPNANSLHPLYRDRLAKAFLFRPRRTPPKRDEDLVDAFRPRLSQITGLSGPYHLINTALNVQSSKVANRRGRNADFFIFSPKFVGSKSTGYVATADLQMIAPALDLATAMAASGAAVSSNMGSQSIKPLTPTLALLNIRLGYWMRNPAKLHLALEPKRRFDVIGKLGRTRNLWANYYFLAEIFGRLSEQYKSVYLTDGGHIENLGIYELLRRRCRVIIAVDAEADPQMAFGSFNTLERYALIDMGIRIDLPWEKIRDVSLKTGATINATGDAPKCEGPHCAIGEIIYPGGHKGSLIYIKASLTGDENDYIFDYKKRYNDFPHETTLDQMFTEEQFEAYRALGFHAAHGLFIGNDKFAHLDLERNTDAGAQLNFLNDLFTPTTPDPAAA